MSSYARRVDAILSKLKGVQYITEARFVHCKNKRTLPFDFYVVSHRTIVEVDGEFHTNPECKKLHANDKIKNDFCKHNDIPLLRIDYTELKRMNDTELRVHIQTFLNGVQPKVPAGTTIMRNILPIQEGKVTFSYIHWNIVILILNILLFIVNFKK